MGRLVFGSCEPCCLPTNVTAHAQFNEDSQWILKITFDTCEPPPANDYKVQYKIKGSSDPWTVVSTATSPVEIVTGDPEGTQYEGYLYSDCGNGNVGQIYFTTITTNCICATAYNETPGQQVFIKAFSCAHVNVTSPVHVEVHLTTHSVISGQDYDYFWNGTIPALSASTSHKILYDAENPDDEELQIFAITSITPSSDANYQYVECN